MFDKRFEAATKYTDAAAPTSATTKINTTAVEMPLFLLDKESDRSKLVIIGIKKIILVYSESEVAIYTATHSHSPIGNHLIQAICL
jgi:hypothetical protein